MFGFSATSAIISGCAVHLSKVVRVDWLRLVPVPRAFASENVTGNIGFHQKAFNFTPLDERANIRDLGWGFHR